MDKRSGRNMRAKPYKVNRWILETLLGFIEASRCKTLDQFKGEKKE
jgi:hypothetical protein